MSDESQHAEQLARDSGRLGRVYQGVYALLCGTHPHLWPWHFQWLATRYLNRDLARLLPAISGRVLDVGCGDKPYGTWLKTATEHVGVDITSGPAVDLVVEPWERWPFPDDSFDGVLCTQVLEHVKDHEHVVAEMIRVLKPGGRLVVSAPFAYCEHGAPDDYQRFSAYGLANLFRGSCDVIEIRRQGGIGSTMAVLFLNWWDCALNLSAAGRIVKGLTLPVWIVASGAVNAAGVLLDWLDHTQAFYGNVLLLARKPCD